MRGAAIVMDHAPQSFELWPNTSSTRFTLRAMSSDLNLLLIDTDRNAWMVEAILQMTDKDVVDVRLGYEPA